MSYYFDMNISRVISCEKRVLSMQVVVRTSPYNRASSSHIRL